jgi:hypothetical protein
MARITRRGRHAENDSVAASKFWKEMLAKRRCIVPAGSSLNGKKTTPEPRPKYKLSVKGLYVGDDSGTKEVGILRVVYFDFVY